MLIVISPAKTLDYETKPQTRRYSQPVLLDRSEELVDLLSTKSPDDLQKMMGISDNLAQLNAQRYHEWSRPFKPNNAKQAVLAFKGDTYLGLEADQFTDLQLEFAQSHLRILSGLYGVLRPLDLMQPYRLEMGTKLPTAKGKNLYEYWDLSITENINNQLKAIDSKLLINLASNEYFKSIKTKALQAEVVTPIFKDWSNGQYRVIGFFAKKARGSMAAWLLKSKAKTLKKLNRFDVDGYQYSEEHSTDLKPVFLRRQD
jgi:cytoplasmic iron level regulating protein YaaA (DUF328/UPF0246 family)